jgi:C4-dicarboxylate-specific signal transduction histidine kinase
LVDSAIRQVQYAGDIINHVRQVIGNKGETHRADDLSSVIDDAMSSIAADPEYSSIAFSKETYKGADRALMDKVQIRQVLINLIRNAAEASRASSSPAVVVTVLKQTNEMLKILIRENGQGFPQSDTDPFSCFASSKADGLGLGLSISRSIVEAHGGSLVVERTGKTGTVVSFTLRAAT